MNARLQHLFERPGLDLFQLGQFVRALMAFLAAWWATWHEDTTSIAWEDGEIGGETRRH